MLEQKPLANAVSSTVLWKQWNSLPSDSHHIHIQSSHTFKTTLKTHLHKQYHKWIQILPSPLVAFLRACLCVCVCVCVWGIQYYDYIIDYFWSFNVYVIVGLVKCAACSPLLVRYGTMEMVAIITVITLTMICSFLQWASAGCPCDSELC